MFSLADSSRVSVFAEAPTAPYLMPPRARRRLIPLPIKESQVRDRIARRDRIFRAGLVIADVLAATIALLLVVWSTGAPLLNLALLLGPPLFVLGCKLKGLYSRDELVLHKTTMDDCPKLFQVATIYALGLWMLDDLVVGHSLGSLDAPLLVFALCSAALLFRRLARFIAARLTPRERVLVIGNLSTLPSLRDKLEILNVNADVVGAIGHSVPERTHTPSEEVLRHVVQEYDADRVLVVPSQTDPQRTLDIVRGVKALGVRVSIVPQILDVVGHAVVFDNICGMTVLGVRQFGLSPSSMLMKRAFDIVAAVIGLVVLAPLFAVIAVAIRLDSKGPIFFRQERIGRGAQAFRIFKFRSMVVDAEARKSELDHLNEATGLFKIADDPRVTRVGSILRGTSLDELPQLLNVLTGHMSIVGPRPLIHSEDRTIKGYDRRRLALTPGMTGHWQIMGSARVPMQEMVKIDYLYVTTWSPFEDMKILVRTVPYMLARRGM